MDTEWHIQETHKQLVLGVSYLGGAKVWASTKLFFRNNFVEIIIVETYAVLIRYY